MMHYVSRTSHILISIIILTSFLVYKWLRESIASPRAELWQRPVEEAKKMPLKVVDATVSDFEAVFEKFKSENPESPVNFLLFLADKDPAKSRSWCPDCNVAEPVIYEKLGATSGDVPLLRAYVGDRPTWRNPNHPLRVDPTFKLRGVPTLIRWEEGAITGRLEDNEAHVGKKIDALLTSTDPSHAI